MAYLGNWQSCPTAQLFNHYSHVVIAFAVSYTYGFPKNQCSTTCEIDEPPVCNNAANQALIQELQAAGKKVILSFGGAGMGGSWAEDVNDCWEYCFGREAKVVNQLTQIVRGMGLDGVDIVRTPKSRAATRYMICVNQSNLLSSLAFDRTTNTFTRTARTDRALPRGLRRKRSCVI